MSITELSIKRPILVIVFFLVTTLIGIISYRQLAYELLPDIAAPFVTVITVYPGASPAEVETSVSKTIEEGIGGVSKVKRVSANSSEGISVITIEFIADADADEATGEVQRAISQLLPELPGGAKTPSVLKLNVNELPVLRLGVTADLPDEALFRLIKDQIRPRLAQLPSVGRVTTLGGQEREIQVLLDDNRLHYYGLSVLGVMESLRRANLDVPIGKVTDTDAQLGIRISGKVSDVAQLENQLIAYAPDGSSIRLRDVGRVEAATREQTVITQLNRNPSVGLVVTKQTGANAVEVSERVRAELSRLESEYQSVGLAFALAQDTSEFTLRAAETVFKDLLIAIVLVALVMLVFLHSLRNALIVMLSIPTSLVFAFILMYVMDFSLNLMTLLAMSLVIGVLVDDSIVVLENIYRHLEMGKDKRTAALEGRNEIGFAALSITLVIVVVFLPIALVPGLVGSLVREFSLVVVVSTLASLLVCFTLTPMIASRFARLEHLSKRTLSGRISLFIEGQITRLTDFYQGILTWSLRFPWAVGLLCIGLLAGSFSLVGLGFIGSEFVASGDKGELSLNLTLPAGSRLDDTRQLVSRLEERISKIPEVNRLYTTIGYTTDINGEITAPNVAQLSINAVPAEQRDKTIRQLSREIRQLALDEPGVKAAVSPVGILGAEAAPILIVLSGENRDSLLRGADQLLDVLKNTPGTFNPRLTTELGQPEVEIVLDRRKLATLGLDIETVGFALRTALEGNDELRFRENASETPIRVLLEKFNRASTDQLLSLSFVNEAGEVVYLKQFADLKLVASPSILERRNRSASVSVVSQVVGRAVGDVGTDIRRAMEAVALPAGVNISYEGDLELADDSFNTLGLALGMSILLMYLIMVALYNNWAYPFVVLFSVPVALVGALLALALTAKTLNVFSVFGIIMLVGLVAKNAILLVDRANEVRMEGRNALYAIIDAGRTRLRPILMTTLAMVIGMLPLALAQGAGSEINSSMAWVLVGGLSSSLVLTLLLVPAVYYQMSRLLGRRKPLAGKPAGNKISARPALVHSLAPVVLLLAGLEAVGQSAGGVRQLSIREAEGIALDRNAELQVGRLEMQKANEQTREARSALLPHLSANANYQHNLRPQVFFLPGNLLDPGGSPEFTAVPASAQNAYIASLDLSLPLLNLSSTHGLALARHQREGVRLGYEADRQRIITQVRKAGYAILLAKSGQQLAEAALARSLDNLAEARNRLRGGLLNETDTLQLYLTTENTRTAVVKAANAVRLAKAQLNVLLNSPEDTDFELSDTLAIQPEMLLADLRSYEPLIGANPEIQRLEAAGRLAESNIRFQRSRLLPQLSGVWQYSTLTQAEDLQFGNYRWVNAHYVGLQLTIPLFSGFGNAARIAAASAEMKQVGYQLAGARRGYLLEAQTYHTQLSELRNQLEVQNKNLAAGERLYRAVRERWQQGLARLTDLQDAEFALNQTRNNYQQLVYEYLVTREELRRILGRVE